MQEWKMFAVVLLLAPFGCHADDTLEEYPTYQGKPVPPIDFAELQYTHPVLKENVQRINSLAGGMHLPHEIPWSRRGPSESDARARHDYLAQWSTHELGVTGSLQPDQRPGMRVLIRLEVEPQMQAKVWRFSLSTDWRPQQPGWECRLSYYCSQAYRADQVGAERLKMSFRHTDGQTRLHVPSSGWSAVVPDEIEKRTDDDGIPLRVRIHVFGIQPTDAQMKALVESPESFLAETLRALDANETRVLAGIAASHRIYLSKRRPAGRDRDEPEFDAGIYEDVPTPKGFALTAAEKESLVSLAQAHFDRQRSTANEHYADMYPTILKAFPIDRYFTRADKPETKGEK